MRNPWHRMGRSAEVGGHTASDSTAHDDVSIGRLRGGAGATHSYSSRHSFCLTVWVRPREAHPRFLNVRGVVCGRTSSFPSFDFG